MSLLFRDFISHINIGLPNECWEWTAYRAKSGYGRCNKRYGSQWAHRAVYLLFYSHIPDTLEIAHSCDNRACCNPNHLKPQTHADNMKEMDERRRRCHGEKHPSAKLSDREVNQIRHLWNQGGWSQSQLGTQFGVRQQYIQRIVRRTRRNYMESRTDV